MPLFLFSLLAGAVTVAGPCILPLLPIILGTSTVRQHAMRPLMIVFGFIVSFSFFALAFSAFGRALHISSESFRTASAIIIGLFGLTMVFPKIQQKIFSKIGSFTTRLVPAGTPGDSGLMSGFILGASLGLVWTPCAGPVLGSILTLVASNQNLSQAAGLLLAYAIGAGIPMLAIAYGGQAAVTRVRSLAKYSETIQRVFGILIIIVAIGLFTGIDRSVQTYLLIHAPWLFLNRYFNL